MTVLINRVFDINPAGSVLLVAFYACAFVFNLARMAKAFAIAMAWRAFH